MLKELVSILLILSLIGFLMNLVLYMQGLNPPTTGLYVIVIGVSSLYLIIDRRSYERD